MDFKDLSKKVAEATIGNARMTDVATGSYTVAIDGEKIFLVSEKKEKIPVSATSLAALRIVEDASKAKAAISTKEARESLDYTNLQKALVAEKVTLTEATKFNVVHRLRIIDNLNDKPVYKNDAYLGYSDYVKASRAAAAMPQASAEQITVRNNAFTEASEALRKSGVKSGVTIEDKNLMLLPVFTVTN